MLDLFDWAVAWDMWTRDMCTKWGVLLFLPVDVWVLARVWLARRKGNKHHWYTWEVILVAVHFIVGGLVVVWLDDRTMYTTITLACWGPILGAFIVRKSREERETIDSANEGMHATDNSEGSPESHVVDIDPVSEPGEDEAGQEELAPGRQGRKGRRRRGQAKS